MPAPLRMKKPDPSHPDHRPEHNHLAQIPDEINGVTIHFAPDVHNAVDSNLVRALHYCIYKSIAATHTRYLHEIWISSVSDHHDKPSQKNSRHNQRKAVDISRINGLRISEYYGRDPHITAVVDGIQEKFELAPLRRENFGPHRKLKNGNTHFVKGHHDHVHLSID